MNVVEAEGKNKQEAVENALEKLGASMDEVIVEEIDSGKTGIFGLRFGKPIKVRVMHKERNVVEETREVINEIYKRMELPVTVELHNYNTEEHKIYFNILTEETGKIIGRRGRTLESVQLLTNIIVNRRSNKTVKIILDVAGYRKKRESMIISKAKKAARYVLQSGRPKELEAMNPFERRLVHLTLQSNKDVTTESEGAGTDRKVKIFPK